MHLRFHRKTKPEQCYVHTKVRKYKFLQLSIEGRPRHKRWTRWC